MKESLTTNTSPRELLAKTRNVFDPLSKSVERRAAGGSSHYEDSQNASENESNQYDDMDSERNSRSITQEAFLQPQRRRSIIKKGA